MHPGHARKLVARMEEMRYDVQYFENTEGGHHASVTHEQQATRVALTFTFLWEHAGAPATARDSQTPGTEHRGYLPVRAAAASRSATTASTTAAAIQIAIVPGTRR